MVKNHPTPSPSIISGQPLLPQISSAPSSHLDTEQESAFSFTAPNDLPLEGSESANHKSNEALEATTVKLKEAISGRQSPKPPAPVLLCSADKPTEPLPSKFDVSSTLAVGGGTHAHQSEPPAIEAGDE